MKYFSQVVYIILFSIAGEALQALIPLPIPAAVYGIVLLLIALSTGILKESNISDVSSFLVSIIPLLFVAPIAKLLQHWEYISPNLLAICVIMVVSTLIVFTVAGLVTKLCQKSKEDKDND